MASVNKLYAKLVLALCICSLYVCAQSPEPTAAEQTGSVAQALTPLFTMTNGFIKTVFPRLRLDTISKVSEDLLGGQVQPWPLTQTILNGYAGFATCVVVGVLLVVLMPLIGCVCCCCRTCNKCGGKTEEVDPKNGKCKRIGCAMVLMIFSLFTVGGMVMIFFSGARIYDLINKDIIADELKGNLNSLGSTLQMKVDTDIVNKTDDLLDGIQSKVEVFLDDSSKVLTSTLLNMTHVEEPVFELANAITDFNSTLLNLVDSLEDFEIIRVGTATNFTRAELLINGTIGSTPLGTGLVILVQQLLGAVEGFSVQQGITFGRTTLADLEGIPNLQQAYKQVNSSIANLIEAKSGQSKTDILVEVNRTIEAISLDVHSVGQSVGDVSALLSDAGDQVTLALDSGKQYAEYGWYGCLALGGIVAIIVLLYLCGLMFGCGSRPGDSSCHKGTGANFFLAAVGFTFIFYSILMLVTTLLFSVGSLASTHVCVAVQDPGTTVTALEDNKLPLNVFGNVTIETVLKAYNDCLGGASIEDIASYIELGFSKTDLQQQINDKLGYEEINKTIGKINIDIGNVTFLPQNLNDSLSMLENFNGFNGSVIPDLNSQVALIKALLDNSINMLNGAINQASGQNRIDLEEAREYFESSRDNGVDEMVTSAGFVNGTITQLSDSVETLKNASATALDAISQVESSIKNNASNIVRQVLSSYAKTLSDDITDDANAGLDELFATKCDDLANKLKDTANIVCDTGLDPFNGLWFSLGWSLIMLIPCMICGLVLANLYRRRSPYDGDYKDDLNRDYDSEHIPLERHY